jgi:hypothetical protein
MAQLRVAASALALAAGAAATAPAMAQTVPSNTAFALTGSLSSQGTATSIARVGRTAGSGTSPYAYRASVPMFSEALGLVSNGNLIGEMAVVLSGASAHVSSNGVGGATVRAEADVSIASVNVTLSLMPTAANPAPTPLLSMSATDLATGSTDAQMLPFPGATSGVANFGTFTLSGSLVGGQTLTFSGSAAPNTVVYDDPNLTVTLNHQMQTGEIVCTPTCLFIPSALTSTAIAVEMHKEIIAGKPANGNLLIGQTEAQLQ